MPLLVIWWRHFLLFHQRICARKKVEGHLERLEKLQHYPSRTIKGTTMFGAVAGMVVAKEVEKFAIKKYLYQLGKITVYRLLVFNLSTPKGCENV